MCRVRWWLVSLAFDANFMTKLKKRVIHVHEGLKQNLQKNQYWSRLATCSTTYFYKGKFYFYIVLLM